ncbi:phosphocholine cytidylyltransferase family protein [Palleronia sediminis]|uniref:Phosphocholine cytidylyltransferase family protein n=1 Tax=Palleronia sediminis TaxID=2547833 RepID=A0A4R6A6V9_9RHOB|nr:phosphocholine cytidylyltransferase family protein [Palleronia sediminis]TDL79400.1 phosphocholine cytidylyltransferase family protein [Palleronia sediminis]
MRALILAAGRGSRMRHLTDDRPKGLTPLRGVPLVARQRAALAAAGVREIGIVTGYRAEAFAPYADAAFHNPRWAETQMVASLARAAEWLRAGPVIVSYSDIFYGAEAVRALAGAVGGVAITYDPDWEAQWRGRFDDPLDDAETFRLKPPSGDGRRWLAGIGRRPRSIDEIEGQYMGLVRITPEGWAAIEALRAGMPPEARDAQSMTELLDALIARGTGIEAIATQGPWGEIDSVEDLAFFEGSAPQGI